MRNQSSFDHIQRTARLDNNKLRKDFVRVLTFEHASIAAGHIHEFMTNITLLQIESEVHQRNLEIVTRKEKLDGVDTFVAMGFLRLTLKEITPVVVSGAKIPAMPYETPTAKFDPNTTYFFYPAKFAAIAEGLDLMESEYEHSNSIQRIRNRIGADAAGRLPRFAEDFKDRWRGTTL